MQCGDGTLVVDQVTKFHGSLRITGTYAPTRDQLRSLDLRGIDVAGRTVHIGPAPGAGPGGPQAFVAHFLLGENRLDDRIDLVVHTRRRRRIRLPLHALIREHELRDPTLHLWHDFCRDVAALPSAEVLSVGGRDRLRSGIQHALGGHRVTILDIVDAPEVDIVGDVHELDRLGLERKYDAFYSVSVFEHLLMPWVAVAQLNAVLTDGAHGFVATHQTLGMHDLPWDFWRFSDTAWDALFNRFTGFEIIERQIGVPQYVLPWLCRAGKEDAELATGFEVSSVRVRKIGPCEVAWPVRVTDIVDTSYPQD